MTAPALSDTAWVDILQPPSPEPLLSLPSIMIMLIVLVLFLITLWYVWQQRPRTRARRQLRRLQRHPHLHSHSPNEVLHAIAQVLREGLRTQKLEQKHFASTHQSQWLRFCEQFNQVRFGNHALTHSDIQLWIQQAEHWLKLGNRHD